MSDEWGDLRLTDKFHFAPCRSGVGDYNIRDGGRDGLARSKWA